MEEFPLHYMVDILCLRHSNTFFRGRRPGLLWTKSLTNTRLWQQIKLSHKYLLGSQGDCHTNTLQPATNPTVAVGYPTYSPWQQLKVAISNSGDKDWQLASGNKCLNSVKEHCMKKENSVIKVVSSLLTKSAHGCTKRCSRRSWDRNKYVSIVYVMW